MPDDYEYKTVKCSLNTVLSKNLNPKERSIANIEIKERCLALSQMTVKASQLAEAIILRKYLAKDPRELPNFNKHNTFVQLFRQGCEKKKQSKPNELMDAVWQDVFQSNGYPKAETFIYGGSLMNNAAKTFKTCFLNNLRENFLSRQRQAIYEYLKWTGREKNIYNLQKLINNWKNYKGPADLKDKDFISRHQAELPKTKEGKTRQPYKTTEYLRYYAFLLSKKKNDDKWFPIVPNNCVKIHYINIDSECVKSLCHQIFGRQKTLKEQWPLIFDITKIRKLHTWEFANSIFTDGVACSIKYFRVKCTKRPLENENTTNLIAPTEPGMKTDEWYMAARIWTMEMSHINGLLIEEKIKGYLKYYKLLWSIVSLKHDVELTLG